MHGATQLRRPGLKSTVSGSTANGLSAWPNWPPAGRQSGMVDDPDKIVSMKVKADAQ